MKRQIIKTRPQRPYVVARIILVALLALALAALVYAAVVHRWAANAALPAPASVGQDRALGATNSQAKTEVVRLCA